MPYFGKWPKWIELFFYSCGKNGIIDFYIFTDCPAPKQLYENVIFKYVTWKEYQKYISETLKINFKHSNPYKLCDIRPFYGYLHKDILKQYDFWGYGDIDLCYGNLSHFLNDKLLSKYDVFSTHANRLSGHFALIRNNEKNRIHFRLKIGKNDFVTIKCMGLMNMILQIFFFPKFIGFIDYIDTWGKY